MPFPRQSFAFRSSARAMLVASCALLAAACSKDESAPLTSLTGPTNIETSSTPPGKPAPNTEAQRAELKKATEYWGGVYAKDPSDAQAAYNYARNLKAMGEKQQALVVLQGASNFHTTHRGILGEYGRLALEFDQITLAEQVLEKADDPANPDWRVISARGTAKAKQGLYKEATTFYERALQLAPDQASILSNLAMAYTMEGQPQKAEPLLRRAAAVRSNDERVNQNLSLVLGLQGKYDEAKVAAQHSVPAERASENVDYVRKIVKAPAKPLKKETAEVKEPKEKSDRPKAPAAAKDPGWTAKVSSSN